MWLPKWFPETNSLIDILTTSASDMGTVGYSLQHALPSQFTLSSLLSTNKVQQKLTSQSVKSEIQSRIDTTASVKAAACLRSLQGKGSGAWLQAIPISCKFALEQKQFQLVAYVRLGIHMSIAKWMVKCDCRKPLDGDGYHLITCKYVGVPVWTHNTTV